MESDCGVIYTPRYPPKQQSNQQTINEAKQLGLTPAKANSLMERSEKEKVREPS